MKGWSRWSFKVPSNLGCSLMILWFLAQCPQHDPRAKSLFFNKQASKQTKTHSSLSLGHHPLCLAKPFLQCIISCPSTRGAEQIITQCSTARFLASESWCHLQTSPFNFIFVSLCKHCSSKLPKITSHLPLITLSFLPGYFCLFATCCKTEAWTHCNNPGYTWQHNKQSGRMTPTFLQKKKSPSYIIAALIFFTKAGCCWHWGSSEQSIVTPSFLFWRVILYLVTA